MTTAFVKSYDYNLFGLKEIEKVKGTFYKFRPNSRPDGSAAVVYEPLAWGEVETVKGTFYKFIPKSDDGGNPNVVYVPEKDLTTDMGNIDELTFLEEKDLDKKDLDKKDLDKSFSLLDGGRRNRRNTKKARKNSYRYSRHNYRRDF